MALINKSDPEALGGVLATSIGRHVPGVTGVRVDDVDIPQSSGLTNDTVLFSASWQAADGKTVSRRLVARIAPAGPSIFLASRLDVEVKVLSALADSDVPVPGVLFFEDDDSLVGAPFAVLEFREGKAAPDDPPFTSTGWFIDLPPAKRRKASDNGLEALAAIHAFDWRRGGLGELDRSAPGKDSLDVVLEEVRDFYAHTKAESVANPTVERGLAWLEENRPSSVSDPVLNWGDSRFGNILFADDQSVSAVLDWEMVCVAPRELDLAWWTFLLRHHTDGIGVPLPDGLPTAEETVKYYEKISGYTVSDFRYYEVIAAVRLSILTQRATSLLIAGGIVPEGVPMLLANPATSLLAELAGVAGPGGEAANASPMNRGA